MLNWPTTALLPISPMIALSSSVKLTASSVTGGVTPCSFSLRSASKATSTPNEPS